MAIVPALIALYPVLKGLCLGVLSFRSFAFQHEVLKGDNHRVSLTPGIHQVMLAFIFLETFFFVYPAVAATLYGAAISYGLVIPPIIAALISGAYTECRKNKVLQVITDPIDKLLDKIPPNVADFIKKCAETAHPWFGVIYVSAQAVLFIVVAVTVNPFLGLAGIGYFAVSTLRVYNYLPAFMAKAVEKTAKTIGLFAGLIQTSTVLNIFAVFNLVVTGFTNFALPQIFKSIFKDSPFLQACDLNENVEKPKDNIPKNVSLNVFESLKERLISKFKFPSNSNTRKEIGEEIDELRYNLKEKMNEQLDKAREEIDTLSENFNKEMEKAKNSGRSVSLSERISYWVSYMKITVKALLSHFRTPDELLDEQAKKHSYATTLTHMPHVPSGSIGPAPEVNFVEFQTLFADSFIKQTHSGLRSLCLESEKFRSIDLNLKTNVLPALDEEKKKLLDEIRVVRCRLEEAKINENNDSLRHIEAEIKIIDTKIKDIDTQKENHYQILINLWKARKSQEGFNLQEWIPGEKKKTGYEKLMGFWKNLWKKEELHPQDAISDEQFFAAYTRWRLASICNAIETGSGMGWDKTNSSVKDFQDKGKYLINFCQNLMKEGDSQKAQYILGSIAIGAGDYCANAAFEMVDDLYKQHVFPALLKARAKAKTLQPRDMLAVYLQQQRDYIFQQVYTLVCDAIKSAPDHTGNSYWDVILADFKTEDFQDRHKYSSIANYAGILNLSGKSNANSDLSNDQESFSDKVILQFMAYFSARILLLLESGYSPTYIVEVMGAERGGGLSMFNAEQCVRTWVNSFENEDLRDSINKVIYASVNIPKDEKYLAAEKQSIEKTLSEFEKWEILKKDLVGSEQSNAGLIEVEKRIIRMITSRRNIIRADRIGAETNILNFSRKKEASDDDENKKQELTERLKAIDADFVEIEYIINSLKGKEHLAGDLAVEKESIESTLTEIKKWEALKAAEDQTKVEEELVDVEDGIISTFMAEKSKLSTDCRGIEARILVLSWRETQDCAHEKQALIERMTAIKADLVVIDNTINTLKEKEQDDNKKREVLRQVQEKLNAALVQNDQNTKALEEKYQQEGKNDNARRAVLMQAQEKLKADLEKNEQDTKNLEEKRNIETQQAVARHELYLKLYPVMLYDYGVIDLTDETLKKDVGELLTELAQKPDDELQLTHDNTWTGWAYNAYKKMVFGADTKKDVVQQEAAPKDPVASADAGAGGGESLLSEKPKSCVIL
jgi:hypothetical protein